MAVKCARSAIQVPAFARHALLGAACLMVKNGFPLLHDMLFGPPMLRINDDITLQDWELTESFMRASGPGGIPGPAGSDGFRTLFILTGLDGQ
jgi:hypothetical protein